MDKRVRRNDKTLHGCTKSHVRRWVRSQKKAPELFSLLAHICSKSRIGDSHFPIIPKTLGTTGDHLVCGIIPAAKPNLCVWCNERNEMRKVSLAKKKKKRWTVPNSQQQRLIWEFFYPQILKYWCVGLAALVGRQPKASVHLLHILCIKQGNLWLLTLVQSWLCEDCWRIEWTKVTFQSHAHTLHTKWVSSIDVWPIWCWFFKRNWSFKV